MGKNQWIRKEICVSIPWLIYSSNFKVRRVRFWKIWCLTSDVIITCSRNFLMFYHEKKILENYTKMFTMHFIFHQNSYITVLNDSYKTVIENFTSLALLRLGLGSRQLSHWSSDVGKWPIHHGLRNGLKVVQGFFVSFLDWPNQGGRSF